MTDLENSYTSRYHASGSLKIGSALPILFLIIGLVGAVLFYSSIMINEKEFRGSLLNEEIMSVKGEILSFHLWLEEYLLGVTESKAEENTPKIDKAAMGVELLLKGGRNDDDLRLSPLRDPALRMEAQAIGELIYQLDAKAEEALVQGNSFSVEDPVHHEIDELSEEIIEKAELLEAQFHLVIKENHESSGKFLRLLFVLWLVFIVIAAAAFYLSEKKRAAAENAREEMIGDLKEALGSVETLSGLLPICSYCAKIRDDSGYWKKVENYISEHTKAEFTHGICDDCAKTVFKDKMKS